MKRTLVCLLMLCVWTPGFAKQIENVDFPEEITLGNQKLVLNGAGLRSKKKFGMNFKVYVAGLYLPSKSTDAATIIASPTNKVLEMVYLRSVDRETIQETLMDGFKANCKADCESAKDAFKAYVDGMIDVKENYRMKLTFDKDGVTFEVKGGKDNKKAQVMGEPVKRAIMAVYLGMLRLRQNSKMRSLVFNSPGLTIAHFTP